MFYCKFLPNNILKNITIYMIDIYIKMYCLNFTFYLFTIIKNIKTVFFFLSTDFVDGVVGLHPPSSVQVVYRLHMGPD